MTRRTRVTELSGGVGGARLARGFAALRDVDLTVIVNVGDDMWLHGLHISPDLDTVVYTLAGVEGPYGWGRSGDSFAFNEELGRFGIDNSFLLGDRDLALKIFRTQLLEDGVRLTEVTKRVVDAFDLRSSVLPATDEATPTLVRLADGWVGFHEYFVSRGHQDDVLGLEYRGAADASPAPGVIDAIRESDLLVIGPSNPLLSIAPILELEGVRPTVAAHPNTVAVSPLIGGKAVKGPAPEVMESMGYRPGNRGVADFYEGLIQRFVVHESDPTSDLGDIEVAGARTLIRELPDATRLASEIVRV